MGMTIDEHIKVLESLFKGRKGFTGQPIDFQGSVDFAIDTMRKYQKIRQIAFPLQFCSTDKLEHEAIMKICKVMEDEEEWE